MGALVQPGLPREEEEDVPVLLERITLPGQKKQNSQTALKGRHEEVRVPEDRQRIEMQTVWADELLQRSGIDRGVWGWPLFQRPADLRVEAGIQAVSVAADPAGTVQTMTWAVPAALSSDSGIHSGVNEREARETAEAVSPVWPLLDHLRRTRQGADAARRLYRQGRVVLPESEGGAAAPALDAETLDRAVERDARRYDRGFALF